MEFPALIDAIAAPEDKEVPLLSMMHTDVRHIDACLDIVEAHWDGLVSVYAHSGEYIDGKWIFDRTITQQQARGGSLATCRSLAAAAASAAASTQTTLPL